MQNCDTLEWFQMWKDDQLQGQYFGLWFMVIIFIWGLSTIIIYVNAIVIISIVLFLWLWNVCPMQGCDDIPLWMFCHNMFGGTSSFGIHNDIINMQLIIILFAYKSHCCLNYWYFISSNLLCGQIMIHKRTRMAHGDCHYNQFWANLGLWTHLTSKVLAD